jgi:hypothetical protein
MPRDRQRSRVLTRSGVLAIGAAAAAAFLAARALRASDRRDERRLWAALARLSAGPGPLPLFHAEMVNGLPAPARRYFLRCIEPGTPLSLVATLEMAGEIGLGDKRRPGYMPMRARQILAPPHGFVWLPAIDAGPAEISGSDAYADGEGWTRFWLGGIVPVARSSATPDYLRSAAARSILEALWVPAAMLPQNGVEWEGVDETRARAVFRHRGERFALTLTVDPEGLPRSVEMLRWTNANPERVFRAQPTGAVILETATVGGYTVPSRLEAGNQFGTNAYFPFFRARLTAIRFL